MYIDRRSVAQLRVRLGQSGGQLAVVILLAVWIALAVWVCLHLSAWPGRPPA